jgi:hypothetical protein
MCADGSQSDRGQVTDVLSRRSDLVARIPAELAEQERAMIEASIDKSLDGLQNSDDQRTREGMKEIIDLLWDAREVELNDTIPRGERLFVQDWWECIFLNCGPRSDVGCVFRCLIFGQAQVE